MSPPRRSGLGPHCVGKRVVVRRVLPGRTGPSGGPAMTDLLGVMESWDETSTVVVTADGTATTIALADIVSGKPVPPRPSPRMRVSPEEACRMSVTSWPAVVAEPLGEWLLRASGGFSARANSAMATGDPGVPLEEAVRRTHEFYARHHLPSWAQVVVGSATQEHLQECGWRLARPGEADSLFQLAPVAQATRAVRRLLPVHTPEVVVDTTASAAWLANDSRAHRNLQAALEVLQGPDTVGFVSARPSVSRDETDGVSLVAKGRVAVCGDWAGVTDVWVSSSHRREGLGLVVMHALLDWAAERGARTAYLQTRADNPPALALYERLGFVTHHTYRYLAAERPPPAGRS